MSEKPSRLSALGPLLSLLFVLLALYIKRPDFRGFVDEKCPWIKEHLGHYAPPFEVRIADTPPPVPMPNSDSTQPPRRSIPNAPEAWPPPPERPPGSLDPAKPGFDLQKVFADPALWPKTVALKRNVYFPAVLNGKSIGILRAPKGSEARLVTIRGGKLGLEYRGGGAWLDVDGTDFEERVRMTFH